MLELDISASSPRSGWCVGSFKSAVEARLVEALVPYGFYAYLGVSGGAFLVQQVTTTGNKIYWKGVAVDCACDGAAVPYV
jgi:hypothetical protein